MKNTIELLMIFVMGVLNLCCFCSFCSPALGAISSSNVLSSLAKPRIYLTPGNLRIIRMNPDTASRLITLRVDALAGAGEGTRANLPAEELGKASDEPSSGQRRHGKQPGHES
jgi:hypothetical protein